MSAKQFKRIPSRGTAQRTTTAISGGPTTLGLLVALAMFGCTDREADNVPPSPEDHKTLTAALQRALADSGVLAGATFDLPVTLETSFGEDGRTVQVIETFRLTKKPRSDFAAVERVQNIYGDRSLLESMYSFENSKGGLREDGEARFGSIGFGADQREILRDLVAGRIGLARPIVDSLADDGAPTRVAHFLGEEISGALELDRRSLTARRIMVLRSNESIIGGYNYAMTLRLTDPGEPLRLPVKMRTEFEYERISSSGSGVIQVYVDTANRAR